MGETFGAGKILPPYFCPNFPSFLAPASRLLYQILCVVENQPVPKLALLGNSCQKLDKWFSFLVGTFNVIMALLAWYPIAFNRNKELMEPFHLMLSVSLGPHP